MTVNFAVDVMYVCIVSRFFKRIISYLLLYQENSEYDRNFEVSSQETLDSAQVCKAILIRVLSCYRGINHADVALIGQ